MIGYVFRLRDVFRITPVPRSFKTSLILAHPRDG